MPLTDVQCRNAKAEGKSLKLTDGNGLFLEVTVAGGRIWRYRYKIDGKENLYTIGRYGKADPKETEDDARTRRASGIYTLQEARSEREACRKLVVQGVHPVQVRREKKAAGRVERSNTFKAIAEEWFAAVSGSWSEKYRGQVRSGLDNELYPVIGQKPIKKVTPADILGVVTKITDRKAPAIAQLVMMWASMVFRWAARRLLVDSDPTWALKGSIDRPPVQSAQPIPRERMKAMWDTLEESAAAPTTKNGIRLLMLTFLRSKEMRHLEWSDIDLDRKLITFYGDKMKKDRTHLVPMSRQVIELLKAQQVFSGGRRYVFPHSYKEDEPMGTSTINRLFMRMGIDNTAHDFRATASTNLNEMGYDSKLVEIQLSHLVKDKVERAYNHAKYLNRRRQMMQDWADWIDDVLAGRPDRHHALIAGDEQPEPAR